MITSLLQFQNKAKELSDANKIEDMFDVFEYETSEEVRDMVYDLADPTSPEPFRSAMINLGFVDF